ncbi:MAG: DUF1800 domain-containing protein [Armatimonadetes bacterium]|nr:DUF1800 domain-containing protein [Armatimonadota bacterium]
MTEREKTAHLLRRFGLGASESEVDFYGRDGLKGAIDRLLDFGSVQEGFDTSIDTFKNNNLLNPKAVQAWLYARLLATKRPLEQKLVVFWHNHFATSAQKVDSGEAMAQHVDTLRQHCAGRFQDLLTAVSKDPAMLYWLDNCLNTKGKPNENFAREIMELFTLGVGNYSEKDIQEAARAFTGWTFGVERNGRVFPLQNIPRRPSQFVNALGQHDTGSKAVFGSKGQFDGDDVIGLLCGKEQTAQFVAHKFWEWFAYENPEPAVVSRVAAKFRASGLDIKVLARAVMESEEFYSAKSVRRLIKNPIDFAVTTARQLGLGQIVANSLAATEGQPVRRFGIPVMIGQTTKAMGMELLYPPDVSGWRTGENWISTATMVERIKLADSFFGGFNVTTKQRTFRSSAFPAMPLFADDPTPSGAAKKIVSVFDATFDASKMRQLIAAASEAADNGAVTARNANKVAQAVARLVFGSPEFQFA